jgi:predicted DNA-binding transcriptional regulator AlpA
MNTPPLTGPPAFVDKAELSRQTCRSETTIDDWVRRGILPQPIRPGGGAPLWRWADVDAALMKWAPGQESGDPYSVGARNAAEAIKRGDKIS